MTRPAPSFSIQRTTQGGASVLVRTRGDPSQLLLAVRSSMSRNDVPLTLAQLRTMEEVLHNSLAVTRAVSDTLMTIGLLAVVLAGVGLYGVVSFVMVGRRGSSGFAWPSAPVRRRSRAWCSATLCDWRCSVARPGCSSAPGRCA